MKVLLYIARLLWFVIRYAAVILFTIAIMIIGFIMVRDMTNVYIIVSEGMEVRASTILNLAEPSDLYRYYSGNYITTDTEIGTSKYDDFLIRGFDYEFQLKSIWCNPWEKTATVEAIESIPKINGEDPVNEEGVIPKELPKWIRTRYRLSLTNIDGAWIIQDMQPVETLPPLSTPTDEPEITPTPEGMTPSPAPSTP